MFIPAQMALMPDGKRLHLHHGPIDLIIEAFGPSNEVRKSYKQAMEYFPSILPGLVSEIKELRKPYNRDWKPKGPVSHRMQEACRPYEDIFVTPMATVAGAVADQTLEVLMSNRILEKIYVNNGGDIAFHLKRGHVLTTGIVSDNDFPNINAKSELSYDMPVRGIATSGWKGRSQSMGIADSVTVMAANAAAADIAATIIANAVITDHPAVRQEPATSQDIDSDLGDKLVTVGVGKLDKRSIEKALESGQAAAEKLQLTGHITAAVLVLQNDIRVVGFAPDGMLAHVA